MKIQDLPPGLKELAELRRSEDPKYSLMFDTDERNDLAAAFHWRKTPEGYYFWQDVYSGNFKPFYNCSVTNLKIKDANVIY